MEEATKPFAAPVNTVQNEDNDCASAPPLLTYETPLPPLFNVTLPPPSNQLPFHHHYLRNILRGM